MLTCCIEYAKSNRSDPVKAGELWIHALTYFTELDDQTCETYIERALESISEESSRREQSINPIIVLQILAKKPKLKFKVIRKYLSDRLDVQDRTILKSTKAARDNLT